MVRRVGARKPVEAEGVCYDSLEKQKVESLMVKVFHSAVLHIQGVRERTALAMLPAKRISYMPIETD